MWIPASLDELDRLFEAVKHTGEIGCLRCWLEYLRSLVPNCLAVSPVAQREPLNNLLVMFVLNEDRQSPDAFLNINVHNWRSFRNSRPPKPLRSCLDRFPVPMPLGAVRVVVLSRSDGMFRAIAQVVDVPEVQA